MHVIAVTGAMGSGKSTTARLIENHGAFRFDSDAFVHRLYRPGGGAVAAVTQAFGDAIRDPRGGVDRAALSRLISRRPEGLTRLEALIHPLVLAAERQAVAAAAKAGKPCTVLDIPLFFETRNADPLIDTVIVAHAPETIRKARLKARPGMREDKLAILEKRQMSPEEKRNRADYLVETHAGLDDARRQIVGILDAIGILQAMQPNPVAFAEEGGAESS